jgi:4-amino-4-deoxy-L-arabinose transferase
MICRVQYSQQMPRVFKNSRSAPSWLSIALLLMWGVGMFGRGYWTPDEPREADIAWRMSSQSDKAVPLLAGEAFCEKPPLTYWLAAVPIKLFGAEAWSARLPNLLYALVTALGVGLLAARSAGRIAGWVGAAAISTFLLAYQVEIWLATDAPLLASVSIALFGAYGGFYATGTNERLRAYSLMHVALGLGFLSKSAVAWMVPAMATLTLCFWERRWRELLRWELYVGLLIQAAMILSWVWFVYVGDQGPAHLKVFFWNNLVGRFAAVDAPAELQYASAHRNFPGKYLAELPIYLFPWTLLVLAAARRAWRQRRAPQLDNRAVRFGIAASLPPLVVLSIAATARNVYFAPALPGIALLIAWWSREIQERPDEWDVRALRATAVLLLAGVAVLAAATALIGVNAWNSAGGHAISVFVSAAGLLAAAKLALNAWPAARVQPLRSQWLLLLAYAALLVGPASQIYRQVDAWQDLASVGRAIARDSAGKPLILLAPDETTRAMIDMYARIHADRIAGPIDAAVEQARSVAKPDSLILVQLPHARRFDWLLGRAPQDTEPPPWIEAAHLEVAENYFIPNGRRYSLLKMKP